MNYTSIGALFLVGLGIGIPVAIGAIAAVMWWGLR